MKCFNHNDKDAIAVCRSCGKGLCSECLVDTGNGIACKGKCEKTVKLIMDGINEIEKETSPLIIALSVAFIFIGAMGVIGYIADRSKYGLSYGIGFLLLGIITYLLSYYNLLKKAG